MNKTILVCGAGGFIGTHLVNDLKAKGHTVIGVDIKHPLYEDTRCNEFYKQDLRDANMVDFIFSQHEFDEVYQLAADMGGAGYIFVGENDADIMHNSATINLNVLESARKHTVASTLKIFYSSSACMYPEHNQLDPDNPDLAEDTAYPANPDSDYGWEKLFSERLYLAYGRCYNMNVKIARFHNIFGPQGSWNNGKEKAPAALCRKVAMAEHDGVIEVWGPGNQTRSFLFIDECVEGIQRIMESDLTEPVNLGSTRKISINELVLLIAERSNKRVTIKNIDGPRGVMGRTSDNKLIKEKIDWAPDEDLETGIDKTYRWILGQIESGVEDV
ncbi:MAG: NAD-dependent dehydratase [Rhodobacteraceae bacterium]|nr:NAD-dependent dehydratase [Paracoccaceae bacterium]